MEVIEGRNTKYLNLGQEQLEGLQGGPGSGGHRIDNRDIKVQSTCMLVVCPCLLLALVV